ncbi:MAG: hypothetical protein ABI440_01375 [Casimicrobiaceae bacterium]
MHFWATAGPAILASFLASLVEFVEALTIVLAVGIARGWRSTFFGTGTAVFVLALLIVTLGQSLTAIPLSLVQVVVGTLLLMFGLRWLRKAVLRAAAIIPLHDEAAAYAAESESLRKEARFAGKLDKIAFAAAFKSVMLEGVEVVFIVIAIGASGGMLIPATMGALLALFLVVILGIWLHRPLAKVPENALKFSVGVILAGFGTFWVGEGIGFAWRGEEWTILVLITAYFAVALALVPICRLAHQTESVAMKRSGRNAQRPLPALWKELIGLFVGDGFLAIGIVLWVVITKVSQVNLPSLVPIIDLAFAIGCAGLLILSTIRGARSQQQAG